MGLSSKRQGNQFEALFERAALRQGIGIIRIADGCRRVGQKRIIPVKQPCDWVMSFDGKTALIDTKTEGKGDKFFFDSINFNQVHSIMSLVRHGALGGYVCWYREVNKLIFIKAEDLLTCEPKSSIKIEQCTPLGPIEDPKLKRIFGWNSLT